MSDVERTREAAIALANEMECASQCTSCGGWQTSSFDASRAELVPYCGGCGVQTQPTIDVWPADQGDEG